MLTDFQNSFTDRFSSKYATKVSLTVPSHHTLNLLLQYLVKDQRRKTSENLKHASLSTINNKVV